MSSPVLTNGRITSSSTRKSALPHRETLQPLSIKPSLIVPSCPTVKHFYPQSLWVDLIGGNADTDTVSPQTTYRLSPHKRLEAGKYVADPYCEDFSNPKYRPTGSPLSPRDHRRWGSEGSSQVSRSQGPWGEGGDVWSTEADTDERSLTRSVTLGSPRRATLVRMSYPVVEPLYPSSAGSLFFPIYYGTLTAKERSDPRGSPKAINDRFHPDDRARMPLSRILVQRNNLNRMCLYKIGPGAVAFKVVINAFEAAGLKYTPSNSHFNILWAKRATPYTLAALGPYQMVNHFPATWGIGRKDSLAVNTLRMREYFGEDVYDIVPASFLIPKQRAELQRYVHAHPGSIENPAIYIVKPSASSCGRGIQLYQGMPPMPRGEKQMVCQRYIGNPLLIFGRKFDLRMYCVVTSFDPLRIYLFDEGLVRFAAEKYAGAGEDLDNIHMHLTNYSVNKTAELSRESKGKENDSDDPIDIKWCLSDLKEHLIAHHPMGKDAWDTILLECEDVVVKTFLSIENEVVNRIRAEVRDRSGRNCFELFGLDLMADDQLKVRLIEVNIMPSLATGTSLDKAVKSRMLAHMLTLIRAVPYMRNYSTRDPDIHVPRGAYSDAPERFYTFGRHPHADADACAKPLLEAFNNPSDPDSMLSPEETLMLIESEEELHCAGGFRCIFPSPSTLRTYLPLFTHGVRRNTYLLASAALMRGESHSQ